MTASILARRPTRSWSVSSGRRWRAGLVVLLLLMLPVAANAYTLVLRSGRLVNVSDKFKVTATAITYEASPGYWITVWLSNVDIAATERANSEPTGSFTRRIKREPAGVSVAPAQTPEASKVGRDAGRKVITNKELERTRLTREAQEEEYERTHRERGMPSRRELRERIEEHDRWLSEWAQRMQEERMEAELESLKSELANVRLHLSELSFDRWQQGTTYAPAYAPPNYYPYFYAPPAHVVTVFPSGRRGWHGRGKFGRYPRAGSWPYHTRSGQTFPRNIRPFRGERTLLRAMPPKIR